MLLLWLMLLITRGVVGLEEQGGVLFQQQMAVWLVAMVKVVCALSPGNCDGHSGGNYVVFVCAVLLVTTKVLYMRGLGGKMAGILF